MSRDARTVYETARSLGIPVMVHTGMGIPFADPVRLYPLVRDFPGVKTVIAHAGSDFFTVQAMQLAKAFDHVWLEPSGVGIEGIEGFLAELPPAQADVLHRRAGPGRPGSCSNTAAPSKAGRRLNRSFPKRPFRCSGSARTANNKRSWFQ